MDEESQEPWEKLVPHRLGQRIPKEPDMHARPEIRTILIAKKLKRWTLIAKYPAVYPGYSPARARRNYWRLCAKYPEIMAMLNLNELSVYEL